MNDLVSFINDNSIIQRYILKYGSIKTKENLISLTDHYNGNVETIFKNCIISYVETIDDPYLIFRENDDNIKLVKKYIIENCNISSMCDKIKRIVNKYKKYKFNYNIEPDKKGIKKLCKCVSEIMDNFVDITLSEMNDTLNNILVFIYAFINRKHTKLGNECTLLFFVFSIIVPELIKDIKIGAGNINMQYVCSVMKCIVCNTKINVNTYSEMINSTIDKYKNDMSDYMRIIISRYNKSNISLECNLMLESELEMASDDLLNFLNHSRSLMHKELLEYQSEENYNNAQIIKKKKSIANDGYDEHQANMRIGLLRRAFSMNNVNRRSPSLGRKNKRLSNMFSIKTTNRRGSLIVELDQLLNVTLSKYE